VKIVRDKFIFYCGGLLAPRPTYNLEDHLLSAAAYSIYSQLPSIAGGHSSICILRTRHAVVTGPPNMDRPAIASNNWTALNKPLSVNRLFRKCESLDWMEKGITSYICLNSNSVSIVYTMYIINLCLTLCYCFNLDLILSYVERERETDQYLLHVTQQKCIRLQHTKRARQYFRYKYMWWLLNTQCKLTICLI
jgi:hypothetical protein